MELDPRTIMFVTACMGPVLGMVLLSMLRTIPSTIRGLKSWAYGSCWIFAGVVFITLRDTIPLGLSVVAGNALIIIGTWMWLDGTYRFLGLPNHRRAWIAAMVLVNAAITWCYYVQPSFVMRSSLISLMMVALLLVHAGHLLRQPNYRYASRFVSFALLVSAADWLLRMGGAIVGLIDPTLFAPTSFNALVNGVQTVAGLLILVGFVLLASERVRHDFEMLAAKDSLTGALMRRSWNAAAQSELDRARRHQRALTLVAMDLDHFKLINDAHGHAVGDQVLINFVAMVNRHLRSADQLGRMGGEEFVLLLPETSLEDGLLVAERIRKATETLVLPCPFTVSMGVAHLLPVDTGTDSLLERADAALYRAKALGRNRVERETTAGDGSPLPPELPPIKSALRRI